MIEMPFDPQCFLNLSSQLCNDINYNEEAKYRTSISRAYYAVFLISRTHLENRGYSISSKRSAHQEVINNMKGVNLLVSNLLFKLRENRKTADYNLNQQVKKGVVISSINIAQKIVTEINEK